MLGDSADADQNSGASASGDYVIHHWRSRAFAARDPSPRCSHSTDRPPALALEIGRRSSPNGSGGGFDRFTRLENGTGYTSLRDLIESPSSPPLPSGARFPATPGTRGGGEIRIKNRLVKQAAHAYLQPTPTSGEYGTRRRRGRTFRRALAILTCGLALEPLDLCITFLRRLLRRPRQYS